MPSIHRTGFTTPVVISTLALFGCATDGAESSNNEPTETAGAAETVDEISLGYVVDPAWGQVPVAESLGLFEQAGLEVEIVNFASGADAMEALLGGAVEVVTAADVPTSAAIVASDEVRIMAQGSSHQNMRIVADTTNDIRQLADLEGRTVGTALGTSAHFMATTFLDQADVDAELVQVAPPELQTALDRGDIDAAAIFEPYATQITQSLGEKAANLQGDPPYMSLVFYNALASTADQQGDAIARMMSALECASTLLQDEDPEARAAIGESTGLEGEVLEGVLDGYVYELSSDEGISDALEELAHWAQAEGNIDADLALPPFADAIDDRSLDQDAFDFAECG